MDSRIREIEQWVAKAKTGLIECGQEDYINRLYLLDAEIRAVIKENGIQPSVISPRHRANKVRRFNTPALVFGSACLAFLLTVTTLYLADPAIGIYARSNTEEPALIATDRPVSEPESTPMDPRPWLENEVLLSEDYRPADTVANPEPLESVPAEPANSATTVNVLAAGPSVNQRTEVGSVLQAPPLIPTPVHGQPIEREVLAVLHADAAGVETPGPESRPASPPMSSGAIEREIGRFTFFPELPDYKEQSPEEQDAINVVKSQLSGSHDDELHVDSGDRKESTSEDPVDNSKR